jgi:hypothetical protein
LGYGIHKQFFNVLPAREHFAHSRKALKLQKFKSRTKNSHKKVRNQEADGCN